MALIICKECGKEISDTAQNCPYCGYSNTIVETKNKSHSKKGGKIAIIVSVILVIVLSSILLISTLIPSLNAEEKLAYENALTMQKMLKSPDSFTLYEEMYIIKCFDEDQNLKYTYTVFEYGGANSYGVTLKSTALFKDDEYIMEFIYNPDNSDYNYLSEEERAALSEVNWVLFLIDHNNKIEPKYELINIDIEKIKKEMNSKN